MSLATFAKASRLQVLPVMVIPVVLGALGAYSWDGVFHPVLFLITLVGSASAHLFSNMINDLWDYRNDTDKLAKETPGAISTNSGFLTKGIWSEEKFAAWTWGLFFLALICGLLLSFVSGWMVLVYGLLGGFFAYFYVAPPIQFGYRGKGYSEVAILLSFGVLPVLGSYYVQVSHFDLRALLVSLPVGLLTTLILFNHHFLHWRADEKAGKRTLVVVMGERKALQYSKGMLILSYVALAAAVLYGALPWYALAAFVSLVPTLKVYRGLKDENPSQAYLPLMKASLQLTMRVGVVCIICLLLQAWL